MRVGFTHVFMAYATFKIGLGLTTGFTNLFAHKA